MASRTQSEQIYKELRRRILILEIRPEERLKEVEWAKKLKVGRLAVREALTRLHGEALVVRGQKGGFFAATMSEADVHEIREIREVLEVAALRLAASRISKAEISELEAACNDFAFLISKGYHTGACEADLRFHRLLVAASGNTRLQRAYDHCHIPLFQIRVGQSREYMKDFSKTEQEHRVIVEAIRSGDFDRAINQLRAHLTRGEHEVLGTEAGESAVSK